MLHIFLWPLLEKIFIWIFVHVDTCLVVQIWKSTSCILVEIFLPYILLNCFLALFCLQHPSCQYSGGLGPTIVSLYSIKIKQPAVLKVPILTPEYPKVIWNLAYRLFQIHTHLTPPFIKFSSLFSPPTIWSPFVF